LTFFWKRIIKYSTKTTEKCHTCGNLAALISTVMVSSELGICGVENKWCVGAGQIWCFTQSTNGKFYDNFVANDVYNLLCILR
jgi:hypothetical protein